MGRFFFAATRLLDAPSPPNHCSSNNRASCRPNWPWHELAQRIWKESKEVTSHKVYFIQATNKSYIFLLPQNRRVSFNSRMSMMSRFRAFLYTVKKWQIFQSLTPYLYPPEDPLSRIKIDGWIKKSVWKRVKSNKQVIQKQINTAILINPLTWHIYIYFFPSEWLSTTEYIYDKFHPYLELIKLQNHLLLWLG